LLVALGGTGYAVTALPKHSVGAPQLKKNAVTTKAVADGSLTSADFGSGQLPQGAPGPKGDPGLPGAPGPSATYVKAATSVFTTITSVNGAGGDTALGSIALPDGLYYVRATILAQNIGSSVADLRCRLGPANLVKAVGLNVYPVNISPDVSGPFRTSFTVDAAMQVGGAAGSGPVTVTCNKGAMAQDVGADVSFSAVATGSITAVVPFM
jgi:hypothetical protein